MPKIEKFAGGTLVPIEWFTNVPENDCFMDGMSGLLASAWLDLHTDRDADYDESTRVQSITPRFISQSDAPALIHTVQGQLVLAPPLKIGIPIEVDLFELHALVPMRFARGIIKSQSDRAPEFRKWFHTAQDGRPEPVLVWHSSPVE